MGIPFEIQDLQGTQAYVERGGYKEKRRQCFLANIGDHKLLAWALACIYCTYVNIASSARSKQAAKRRGRHFLASIWLLAIFLIELVVEYRSVFRVQRVAEIRDAIIRGSPQSYWGYLRKWNVFFCPRFSKPFHHGPSLSYWLVVALLFVGYIAGEKPL